MSPVRSIATCLAAQSPSRGSDSPLNCRLPGLTSQRPVDPRLGIILTKTRDFVRACPHVTSGSSLFCPLSKPRSPSKGLDIDRSVAAGSAAVITCHSTAFLWIVHSNPRRCKIGQPRLLTQVFPSLLLFVPSGQVVYDQMTPVRLAPDRLAPDRLA